MAQKFGLGRGLSDLEKEMGAGIDMSILRGGEHVLVKQIPLFQIGANPDQPRKTFSPAELSELADSIREKGVLQPILLREVSGQPYKYEIVAGERRYRASKQAGLNEIPALVKKLTDENAMEIALIENVQRENLNPIEEGAAYDNLIKKCGYGLTDVSRLIGKSESYIRNIIRIAELPSDVKEMVADGQISLSHAIRLTVAENPSELARDIVQNKLSVADTTTRVKRATRNKTKRAFVANTLDDGTIKDMVGQIKNSLGVNAKIREKRGGAGEVILSYTTRTQLQDLIKQITAKK